MILPTMAEEIPLKSKKGPREQNNHKGRQYTSVWKNWNTHVLLWQCQFYAGQFGYKIKMYISYPVSSTSMNLSPRYE